MLVFLIVVLVFYNFLKLCYVMVFISFVIIRNCLK